MNKTLQKALNQTALTNQELARYIHKEWQEADPDRAKVPSERSLENYLSQLRGGDEKWWRNPRQHVAREKLAEALDTTEPELFGVAGPVQTEPWFRDFPGLEFDPEVDAPPKLGKIKEGGRAAGKDLWEYAADREAFGVTWVVAPAGAGKSLAVRWAQAHGIDAYTVDYLRDAAKLVSIDRQVVFEVHRRDPATDKEAYGRLQELRTITVLASFPPPPRSFTRDGYRDWLSGKEGNRLFRDLTREGLNSLREAKAATWVPAPDASERLAQWLIPRAGHKSGLPRDPQRLAKLAESLKQSGAVLETPGDLLWLYGLIDRDDFKSVQQLQTDGLLALDLRARIGSVTRDNPVAGEWLTAHASDCIKALLRARLKAVALPFTGPLGQRDWASLVPSSLATPNPDLVHLRSELDSLRTKKLADQPSVIDRLLATITQPDPLVVVQRFVIAGILRQIDTEHFDMSPRWGAAWLTARVAEELVQSAPGEWGGLLYEPERRAVLDRALDNLVGRGDFGGKVVAPVLTASVDHATVGAIEALYAAVARARLAGKTVDLEQDAATQLFQAQQRYLLPCYAQWPSLPASRGTTEFQNDLAEHTANTWAWSEFIPCPDDIDAREIHAWTYPGWATGLVLTEPERLKLPHTDTVDALIRIAIRLRFRCVSVFFNEDEFDPLLATAGLLANLEQGRLPTKHGKWNPLWVASWLASRSADDAAKAALLLIRWLPTSAISFAEVLPTLDSDAWKGLGRVVLRLLTPVQIAELVAESPGLFHGMAPRELYRFSAASQLSVAHAIASSPTLHQDAGLDPDLVEASAIEVLFRSHPQASGLGRSLWLADSQVAVDVLRSLWPDLPGSDWLVWQTPNHETARVLALLDTVGFEARPSWLRFWASLALRSAPSFAKELWLLAQEK
jgi:hypothetical protein